MLESFLKAYEDACAAADLTPSPGVAAATGHVLDLRGNVGKMRTQRFTDVDVPALTSALQSGHPFEEIDLSFNRLTAKGVAELATFLQTDSLVRAFSLAQNDVTSEAIQELCMVLKGNMTLEELSLSGNALGGAGGLAVADLLQSDNNLKKLRVSNCELDTESLVALATVLQANERLALLDISRSLAAPLMEEATSHFSRMLKVNATLEELDLSCCGIRDLGLQLLAEELFRAFDNSRLSVLRLRGNHIHLVDSACVGALNNLLSSNSCRLTILTLGGNVLKDEGALKLADILAANSSLTQLDVSACAMRSRGLCAIGRAIAPNARSITHPKLLSVSLWGNSFDSAACLVWQPIMSVLELDILVQEVDGVFNCVQK
ncbi:hypothetical protein AB1Y20_014895 [Prymnesium parvum]|uniref:Distal membrane arm assembly complex 2-like protein n=1 Tax=Prymnesium parvum TaxID=97485 RepID=A0AB34JYZ6_PRYPA